LAPVPALAGVILCQNIEYAELKDMDREDLAKEYCQSKKLLKVEFAKPPSSDLDQHMKNLESCMGMEKRIERIFKSRKEKLPTCGKE
jgi:hypothetical protein